MNRVALILLGLVAADAVASVISAEVWQADHAPAIHAAPKAVAQPVPAPSTPDILAIGRHWKRFTNKYSKQDEARLIARLWLPEGR